MKISVIIVSFNTRAILKKCLEALYQNPGSSDLEVFVVDNNSSDESADMIKQHFQQVILIENPINSGFAAANNMAYAQATGDYIILLNPDAYVKPGTVSNSVRFMENHLECGICGARLIKPDGSLDPSARRFPNSLYKLFTISGLSDKHPSSKIFGRGDFKYFDHNSVMEVDWVPGTFTIYRREMVSQIGFLDNRFYLYYEETDLCLRADRAGWKTFFNPAAEVIHIGGASSKTRKDLKFDKGGAQVLKFRMRSECLYFRKNYGLFSMLANSGVEIGWHCLRFLVNLRPGEHRLYKRQESTELIRHGVRAIRDTHWGKTAPEIPW
ncbi:glycosyltransferase family 2 protein [Desulfococcaceae bacterium HSG7]|nr:glycosyltransferase family 2 protein [Desulfococcaceae bacterium HSG7]